MAGLDSTGFTIKRQEESVSEQQASELQKMSSELTFGDDTVISQFNEIIALEVAKLWELGESINSNFNKNSAEAKNLDDLGDLIGVLRQTRSKSAGIIEFIGADGTVIFKDYAVKSSVTANKVLAKEETKVSSKLCKEVTYSVGQVLDTTDYDLSINNIIYSYTSDASATANEIVAGIKALIDADTNITWSATLDGDNLVVATTDELEISVSSETYLSVVTVTKNVIFQAEDFGAFIFPADTLTVQLATISGITSVNNPDDFVVGRLDEEDEEYRKRFSVSNSLRGKATLPSIRSAVSDVAGVSNVIVLENTTAAVDANGLDPHSFEVIVQGGEDEDVAISIWNTKPSSIGSFGASSLNIDDSIGTQRTVFFTRPTVINMAVQVTYAVYSEEVFPDNGKVLISDIVLAAVNALVVGVDVIPQRLIGPIYAGVAGIQDLTVEIQTLASPGDTPSGGAWVETPIAISQKELAQTTLTDITIVAP